MSCGKLGLNLVSYSGLRGLLLQFLMGVGGCALLHMLQPKGIDLPYFFAPGEIRNKQLRDWKNID